jgi:DNA repair exonuclease SbcCD nuclease subunit
LSDTHLGYRQYGLSERLEDWNRATAEIIDYSIKHEVDFVVHSGDLFNSNKVDHTSLIHAIKLLGCLKDANIPLFVTDGNHDRRKGAQKHGPNNVLQQLELCHYLTPEGGGLDNAVATIGEVNIIGLGYQGIYLKSRLEDFYQQIPDGINIVLLHAGVEQYSDEAQPDITSAKLNLLRPKTAYLALGHYHNKFDIDNWVYNPGSPEYYRFSDCGIKRYFYDVTLKNGAPYVAEREVKNVRHMESLTIEHPNDDYVLVQRVKEELDHAEKNKSLADSLLRIVLNGKIDTSPNVADLRDFVEDRYLPLYCTIVDGTTTKGDLLIDDPRTMEELELRIFEQNFSHYKEQASDIAAFARGIMKEIIDAPLKSAEDAELIAQHVSNFRRNTI